MSTQFAGSAERELSETAFSPGPILLVGPPGVGKGTQAKAMMSAWQVPQVSTGDLLRGNVSSGTELGKMAKAIMDRGELVPDDLVNRMVAARLVEPDSARGFVLDGFPRTLGQAEWLDANMAVVLPRVTGDCGRTESGLYSFSASNYGSTQLSSLRKYLQRLPAAAEVGRALRFGRYAARSALRRYGRGFHRAPPHLSGADRAGNCALSCTGAAGGSGRRATGTCGDGRNPDLSQAVKGKGLGSAWQS